MTSPNIPVDITFRHLDPSAALKARIHEKVQKLAHFYHPIQRCHVTVSLLHRHPRQGRQFHVRLSVKVPGHELVANREPDENPAYTDVYVALRDAFSGMRRQLESLLEHQQGQLKHHEEKPHGHITEIAPDKTYGRIESPDGRWLYFHRNSLIGAELAALEVGTPVYYVEEMGDDGPQASSVYPVGKHHILV